MAERLNIHGETSEATARHNASVMRGNQEDAASKPEPDGVSEGTLAKAVDRIIDNRIASRRLVPALAKRAALEVRDDLLAALPVLLGELVPREERDLLHDRLHSQIRHQAARAERAEAALNVACEAAAEWHRQREWEMEQRRRAEAALAECRATMERQMISDESTNGPFNEDMAQAIAAAYRAVGDGESAAKWYRSGNPGGVGRERPQ